MAKKIVVSLLLLAFAALADIDRLKLFDGHKGVSCTEDGLTCYIGSDENRCFSNMNENPTSYNCNRICKVDMEAGTSELFSYNPMGVQYDNMHGVFHWTVPQNNPVCNHYIGKDEECIEECIGIGNQVLFVADTNNNRVVVVSVTTNQELVFQFEEEYKVQHIISGKDGTILLSQENGSIQSVDSLNVTTGKIDTLYKNSEKRSKKDRLHGMCYGNNLFVMATSYLLKYLPLSETMIEYDFDIRNKKNKKEKIVWHGCLVHDKSGKTILLERYKSDLYRWDNTSGNNPKKFSRHIPRNCASHAIAWKSKDQDQIVAVCEFGTDVSVYVINYPSGEIAETIKLNRPCLAASSPINDEGMRIRDKPN